MNLEPRVCTHCLVEHSQTHVTLTRSGMSFSIVTFDQLGNAIKAFETLQMQRFDHKLPDGQTFKHWCSVRWFEGK